MFDTIKSGSAIRYRKIPCYMFCEKKIDSMRGLPNTEDRRRENHCHKTLESRASEFWGQLGIVWIIWDTFLNNLWKAGWWIFWWYTVRVYKLIFLKHAYNYWSYIPTAQVYKDRISDLFIHSFHDLSFSVSYLNGTK